MKTRIIGLVLLTLLPMACGPAQPEPQAPTTIFKPSDMNNHPNNQTATITEGHLFEPPQQRDPEHNTILNPIKNPSINPIDNANINPAKNANINPVQNPNINPVKNANIDPLRNANINPAKNPNINPEQNPNIHPAKNTQLNPTQQQAYNGYYEFMIHGTADQIALPSEDGKLLYYFDAQFVFTKYAVSNGAKGYNVFDRAGQWLGYLQSNGAQGYNFFNIDHEWKAYLN